MPKYYEFKVCGYYLYYKSQSGKAHPFKGGMKAISSSNRLV